MVKNSGAEIKSIEEDVEVPVKPVGADGSVLNAKVEVADVFALVLLVADNINE